MNFRGGALRCFEVGCLSKHPQKKRAARFLRVAFLEARFHFADIFCSQVG